MTIQKVFLNIHGNDIQSALGQDKGYTVKYKPLPEGVPKGKVRGNSQRQRAIFDRIFRVVHCALVYIVVELASEGLRSMGLPRLVLLLLKS